MRNPPGQRPTRRMNRRQRKKLHVAEFTEVGLFIEVQFHTPLDESAWDEWIARWMDQAAQFNLEVGGFGGKLPLAQTNGWLFVHPHGSVTPDLSDAVSAALVKDPAVAQLSRVILANAWYADPSLPG